MIINNNIIIINNSNNNNNYKCKIYDNNIVTNQGTTLTTTRVFITNSRSVRKNLK